MGVSLGPQEIYQEESHSSTPVDDCPPDGNTGLGFWLFQKKLEISS